MQNTSKIGIFLPSKYQSVFDDFYKSILPTLKNFPNFKIFVVAENHQVPDSPHFVNYKSVEWGNNILNSIMLDCQKQGYNYFGVITDDVRFKEGWLEDVIEKLDKFDCASPGYIETEDMSLFDRGCLKSAAGQTGIAYGPIFIFRMSVVRRIGLFDENIPPLQCLDMDWFWRLKINGLTSTTSKKITVIHLDALTRKKMAGKKSRENYLKELDGTDYFIKRHGYQSYRFLKGFNKDHLYFKNILNEILNQ